MEEQLENLKCCYLDFFEDCDSYIRTLNLPSYIHRSPHFEFKKSVSRKELNVRYIDKINWHLLVTDNIEQIQEIESLIPCIEKTREIFELKQFQNSELLERSKLIDETIKYDKLDIPYFYSDYKKLHNNYGLSANEFLDDVFERYLSNDVFSRYIIQLFGFRSQIETFCIDDITIRKASDDEISDIINNNVSLQYSSPEEIAIGPFHARNNNYYCFIKTCGENASDLPIDNMNAAITAYSNNTMVRDKIKNLILALRLYSGNFVGCRTFFQKNSFISNMSIADTWNELELWNPKFTGYLHHPKEIVLEDIPEIESLFNKISTYNSDQIGQITIALEHFFEAFDQDYPLYVFTELIMSLESIFSEHQKSDKDKKMILISNIRSAENNDDALSKFEDYNHKNSSSLTIKRLHNLLSPDKKDSKLYSFFNGDNKTEIGCYKLRNDLIHGNIALDNQIINSQIEPLKKYVRLALIKLICLRVESRLQCSSDNYFEELDNILEISR
jgi:hypothetical protein